ncbi:replication initiation protein RepM [Acinetobacter sp. YH18001]|uniref:replication initiation protein RepM n=1 Tax=Acinetobacter sp. YH18001 TaxID=2601197 RepID=UPI00359F725E
MAYVKGGVFLDDDRTIGGQVGFRYPAHLTGKDKNGYYVGGYVNQFGVHRNTAYQALKDACNDLFARQFSYQKINERGNIENYRSRWVSEIGYVDNEAVVKLIFAPAIVPLITRLEEHFTKYELQQVSNLSSAYAVRLYELLIAWRSTGSTPVIELSDFRQRIGVLDTEYKRMERFKTSVLELAIKQINEHTDITVKYEQHKKGRSISGFSFTFKQKKKDNPSIERDPNTLDLFSKMTDAQRHMFANKLSELPEMGRYSQGTESYPQFAVRIAEMLQDSEKIKELAPYLKKVGYMPSNKKDTVNG